GENHRRDADVRRDFAGGQSPEAKWHTLSIWSLDLRPEHGARRAGMRDADLQQAEGKQTGGLSREHFELQLFQERRALHFHPLLNRRGRRTGSRTESRPNPAPGPSCFLLVTSLVGKV